MSRLKSATLADQNITTELTILTKVLGAIVPEYPLRGRVRVSGLAANQPRTLTLRVYADGEPVCSCPVLFTSGPPGALCVKRSTFSGVSAEAGATITLTLASDNAGDTAVGITARLDVDAVPDQAAWYVNSSFGHDTDHDGRHPMAALATLAAVPGSSGRTIYCEGSNIGSINLNSDSLCARRWNVAVTGGATAQGTSLVSGLQLYTPSAGVVVLTQTAGYGRLLDCIVVNTAGGVALRASAGARLYVAGCLIIGDVDGDGEVVLARCWHISGTRGPNVKYVEPDATLLARLDVTLSTRATQTSVNALGSPEQTGAAAAAVAAAHATTDGKINALGSPEQTGAAAAAVAAAHATTDGKVDAAKASADAAARPGNAMTLTSAYDAAKTAAQSSDIPTAAANAAKADEVLAAAHGAGSWEGVAESDWTAAERKQIRQALGVTGLKAAAVDGDLQAIKAKTDTIGAVEATYTSPAVTTSGPWEIHCGSAYREVDGRAITLVISGYGGPSLVGAEAALRLLARHRWAAEETVADLEVAATVSVDGTTVTLSADLEGEETAALEASPPRDTENYRAQFVVTPAGGEAFVIGDGELTALKGIGPIPEPVEE